MFFYPLFICIRYVYSDFLKIGISLSVSICIDLFLTIPSIFVMKYDINNAVYWTIACIVVSYALRDQIVICFYGDL